jgi:hypothetical protein
MASTRKSRSLDKAVEAFGELAADVIALGKPISVHPPSTAARIGARFSTWSTSKAVEKKAAIALTIALPLLGAGFLIPYLNDTPFGKAPPVGWLSVTGAGVLFGLIAGGFWWHLSRTAGDAPAPGRPDRSRPLPGMMLYPTALVHVCDGTFTVIRWEDVKTLEAPAAVNCWRLTARDGRQIDIPGWVEDEGTAIESIFERVSEELLPHYMQRIEEGKKVMFGPFGVSQRYVYYEDKKLSWEDVTSMKLLTGAAVGLQIRCGTLLPWCTYHLMKAPNGCVAYKVLPRVAPSRLLKPE